PEFESAGRADARDRRRRDRNDDRAFDLLRFLEEVEEDRARVFGLRRFDRLVALAEILERHKEGSGIRLEAAVEQAVTGDHRPRMPASTCRLNHASNPRCGGGLCLSSVAHIAGVSVSAMNPETDTDTTIVSANCL